MRFDSPTPVPLVARPTYWLTAATVTGLLVVLVFALWPKEIPQSKVRVRNASSVTLQNVVVGKAHYGDLGPGESSQYQTWGPRIHTPAWSSNLVALTFVKFQRTTTVKARLERVNSPLSSR